MSSVRAPYVRLFTPGEIELLIDGKNVGLNHVKSYNYTYKETEKDTCKIVMAFSEIQSLRLDFFRPSMPLWVKWGYLNYLTPYRKLVITEAEWSYDMAGHKMTLTLIPEADYLEEHGDLLYNGTEYVDTLIQTGEVDVQFIGAHYKYSFKGNLDGRPSLTSRTLREGDVKEAYRKSMVEAHDQVKRSNELQSDIVNPRNLDISGVPKKSQYNDYMSMYNYHAPLGGPVLPYPGSGTPFMAGATEGLESSTLVAWENLLKYHSPNLVKDNRDGKTTLKEIGWGDKPSFYLEVGNNIISYKIETGSDDSNSKTHVCTSWEVEDKAVNVTETSSAVNEVYPFTIRLANDERESSIRVNYIKNANGCFIANQQTPEDMRQIDEATFQDRAQQFKIQKELVDNLGESMGESEAKELYTKHGKTWADVDEFKTKHLKQLRLNETILRREVTGDIVRDNFSFLYGGRDLDEIFNVALKNELDQLFYNTKVVVKIEGSPNIETGFNFYLSTGNPQLSGVFHADEVGHKIEQGKYILELVGYRVVQKVQQIRQKIQEKVDGLQSTFETFEEQQLVSKVAEEINKTVTDQGLSFIEEYLPFGLGVRSGLNLDLKNKQILTREPNTFVDINKSKLAQPIDTFSDGTDTYNMKGYTIELRQDANGSDTPVAHKVNPSSIIGDQTYEYNE